MATIATSNFIGSENPLYESGFWRTGDSIFGYTQAIQKVSGYAKNSAINTVANVFYAGQVLNDDQFQRFIVDINLSATGWGTAFFIRYNVGGGSFTGYYLDIDSAGTASIVVRVASVDTILVSTVITWKLTQVISIEAIGTTINVYLDDIVILTVDDATYSSGEVGFAIFIPVTGSIDDVKISSFEVGDGTVALETNLVDNLITSIADERVF